MSFSMPLSCCSAPRCSRARSVDAPGRPETGGRSSAWTSRRSASINVRSTVSPRFSCAAHQRRRPPHLRLPQRQRATRNGSAARASGRTWGTCVESECQGRAQGTSPWPSR
eukprot:11184553-Lingulodinium_polyedra.AAC.1